MPLSMAHIDGRELPFSGYKTCCVHTNTNIRFKGVPQDMWEGAKAAGQGLL